MRTILSLQYLRGIAALLVLIFHMCEHNHIEFNVGSAGVDIFFVISGFVMWFTTFGRSVTFKQFVLRRVQRLVPLYWTATLITAVFAAVTPQFFYGVTVGVWEVFESILFIPYSNSDGHHWPIVLQGWTLNIEIFFYGIFATSVALRPLLRLFIPTIVLTAVSTAGWLLHPSNALFALWSSNLLIELAAGLWLGFAFTNGWLQHRYFGWILVIFSIGAFTIFQMSKYPVDNWRLLFFGLPAITLVTGCLMIELSSDIPRIPALLFLGDASYSIYLWHGLAIVAVGAVFLHFGVKEDIASTVVLGIVVLCTSLLGFLLIERPLTSIFGRTTTM
jgi:exopolysaccharide production protein ExoZ